MMTLEIHSDLLAQIFAHGEAAYPDEGAGLLLGVAETDGQDRRVTALLPLTNSREDSARHNRYLITPRDLLQGEMEAARLGLDVLGIFHSHPDHPNQPSEFDRDWALPWYSYIITTIASGRALESRSWRLNEDRASFFEEKLVVVRTVQNLVS